MYATIRMNGIQEEIVELAVRAGIAKNKTDVLSVGVMELNNKYHLLEQKEDIEERHEAERIYKEVKSGRMKTYTLEEIRKE
jgi:hypothetical protein